MLLYLCIIVVKEEFKIGKILIQNFEEQIILVEKEKI
jgi:hypothetical protein